MNYKLIPFCPCCKRRKIGRTFDGQLMLFCDECMRLAEEHARTVANRRLEAASRYQDA